MKTRIAYTIALALICYSMTSCVTTETTVTSPDGTITTTKTSGPDAASVQAAVAVAQIIDEK